MGGFFGAVSHEDVTLDIFFGVDYHSHLGTRRGGMLIHDEKGAAASAVSVTPIPSLCWSGPTWGCMPSPRWASSITQRS